jgi:uncharacterized RDD family membrane protein YckC
MRSNDDAIYGRTIGRITAKLKVPRANGRRATDSQALARRSCACPIGIGFLKSATS